jgi:hypothetical protein
MTGRCALENQLAGGWISVRQGKFFASREGRTKSEKVYHVAISDPAPLLPTPTSAPDTTPAPPAVEPTPTPPAALVIPPNPGETITSLLTHTTYTFGERIGEGFFGLVFGCVNVWNNSLAVKVLKGKAPYEASKKRRGMSLRS